MTKSHISLITPDWPAPKNVVAFTTTRQGGISAAPYDSLNLALHVSDNSDAVFHNRHLLRQHCALPAEPHWLTQTHSTQVVKLEEAYSLQEADASYTDQPNRVCAVLTADCLPLLLCDRAGTTVAAIHAGWRGLANGIIEHTLSRLAIAPSACLVWLGPAISASAYEVGEEVYHAFIHQSLDAKAAFTATRPGHWLMDIYLLARQRLSALGVSAIYGGQYCTYHHSNLFYSYRREKQCGRMVSLIYLT